MSDGQAEPTGIHARLHLATAADRRDILHELMAAHPEGKLILLGNVESRLNLRDIPLSDTKLRGATMAYSDLHNAELSGANLSQASLSHAALEGANLENADLTEVDLDNANLGEANLRNALLEDANLEKASLRFANLGAAVLESARLQGADLWGAEMGRADLSRAQARGATFGEAKADGADFRNADLRDADFANASLIGANLGGADLRGANLRGADLSGADLAGAAMQGLDLAETRLNGARWAGALLNHTRFVRQQIGDTGEEAARDPIGAARAYLTLERNFTELGDSAASSWAYLKRRRMQKWAAFEEARQAVRRGKMATAFARGVTWIGDTVVEWSCNYGESLWRTFATILAVYIAFTVVYGVTDGVYRMPSSQNGGAPLVTHRVADLAVFSIMAMTTSGLAGNVLQPANLWISFLGGVQILVGIFLTGLLGFVAGNRIRR